MLLSLSQLLSSICAAEMIHNNNKHWPVFPLNAIFNQNAEDDCLTSSRPFLSLTTVTRVSQSNPCKVNDKCKENILIWFYMDGHPKHFDQRIVLVSDYDVMYDHSPKLLHTWRMYRNKLLVESKGLRNKSTMDTILPAFIDIGEQDQVWF